jgi:hypothetical protein
MEYVEALGAIGLDPLGVWIHELGQYWCIFDSAPDPSYSGITGTTSKIWAYSYSRSSKVACWSEYTLPIRVTGVCSLNGKVYLRDADKLYLWDEEAFTDDGTAISVEVQMAFQNAKTPGVDKQFYGADYVFEGAPSISFKYDPRDQTKETIPQQVDGDTAPGTMIPVEVVAPSIAPVFRHSANEAFELSQISVYYNPLTVT